LEHDKVDRLIRAHETLYDGRTTVFVSTKSTDIVLGTSFVSALPPDAEVPSAPLNSIFVPVLASSPKNVDPIERPRCVTGNEVTEGIGNWGYPVFICPLDYDFTLSL
jgi:hypothetical protein